jgi:alkylation response protein AidB-like acyl-CoA dehydrogenase
MDLSTRLTPVLETARAGAGQVDATGTFPQVAVDALRASGLFGLTLPADVGGLGGGPEDLVEVLSEIAAACGSTAMVYLMHVSAAMAIAAAPPPVRADLLPRLATDALGTLALSEGGSRSHFWAPLSQGAQVADADGGVHVKADKSWVTSAGHADVYVVSTLTP